MKFRIGFLGAWALFVIAAGALTVAAVAEIENLRDARRLARVRSIDRMIGERMGPRYEDLKSVAGERAGRVSALRSKVARTQIRLDEAADTNQVVVVTRRSQFRLEKAQARLHIVEGYSGLLTQMVLDGDLDFAVVPAFEGAMGLKSRLLVRDREMLISGPKRGLSPLAPVRLADVRPLKIVVPGPDNIRRRNLDTYFQSHGVEVEAMLEMDAMIATLEFVAGSDWVTVLPSVISVNDIGRGELTVNPIVAPELHAEFVVIQPTRRSLSTQARLFLERFEREVAQIHQRWDEAIRPLNRRSALA